MPDTGIIPSTALLTLPNIISFARLCAVPFAIWFVLHAHFGTAFTLFVLAGLSDAVDGWIARRRGGSVLGSILDPLADKALMVGMYVTLAVVGQVPDWLAMLVVFRDAVIVGGVMLLWMTTAPMLIRPLEVSKANTALQIGLVAVVLGLDAAGLKFEPVRLAMVVLVTVSTLFSGAAYVVKTARGQ